MSSKEGFSVVAPTRTTSPRLDVGQEGVLLGAVEAVDLVDEEEGAPALGLAQAHRLGHDLLDLLDAGGDGREGDEVRARSRWR